jgi:hypothetical protein
MLFAPFFVFSLMFYVALVGRCSMLLNVTLNLNLRKTWSPSVCIVGDDVCRGERAGCVALVVCSTQGCRGVSLPT